MKQKMSKQQLLVLVGVCMFQLALTGILYNTLGVIMTEIRTDLQIPVSRVSSFNTIRALSAAFCSPLIAKLFFKYDSRKFLLFMTLEIVLGYYVISVAPTTWVWYLAAVLFCPATVLGILVIPYILMPWFPNRSGVAIGFAAAFSGVGGVVFSPCAAMVIAAVGWRGAIVVFCGITLLLSVAGILLTFRYPAPVRQKTVAEKTGRNTAETSGSKEKLVLQFLLCCVVLMGGGICAQFVSYISMYATSVGYSLVIAATITSAVMAGNIGGKLIFGILHDTIGVWKTVCTMLFCIGASAAGFVFFYDCLPVLYVCAVLFGFSFSMTSMAMTKCCVAVYGEERSKVFSGYHTGIATMTAAGAAMSVGLLYDRTQSFIPMFVTAIAASLIAIVAALFLAAVTRKKNAAQRSA